MARYDDGKRGFGVADAIGLELAWQEIETMLSKGLLNLPCDRAPPRLLAIFSAVYAAQGVENVLHTQLQREEAERLMILAIKSGSLPLWIAPVEGPIAERIIAANGLLEFEKASLKAGCYRPYNDTENLAYGYPLFVKRADWSAFRDKTFVTHHEDERASPVTKKRAPSVKAGRAPTDDHIIAKADEMRARGMTTYLIASSMRLEPGFENVATTVVRDLIKGRYKRTGRGGAPKE